MIEKLEYQADIKIKKFRTEGKIQKVRSLHVKFPSKENIFVKINELVDAVNKQEQVIKILIDGLECFAKGQQLMNTEIEIKG